MLSDYLTIIVPTHERHKLVFRFIDYFKKLNVPVIIADSSTKPLVTGLPNGFIYLHCPNESFGSKLYKSIQNVKTPYVCMCADDDFMSLYGLSKGVDFLEENNDYASVQGQYISFSCSGGIVSNSPMYMEVNGYATKSDDPEERIRQAFNPYMHHFYSLHKTKILSKALHVVANVKAVTPVEMVVPLVSSVYGKHCMIPVFWAARDTAVYSSYTSADKTFDTKTKKNIKAQVNMFVVKDWMKYLDSEDGVLFKKNYCNEISDVVKDKKRQQGLFDAAFVEYTSRNSSKKSSSDFKLKKNIRATIKTFLPNYSLKFYRSIRDMVFRYKNPLGYPWSNEYSAKDWERMVLVIMKHRDLVMPE